MDTRTGLALIVAFVVVGLGASACSDSDPSTDVTTDTATDTSEVEVSDCGGCPQGKTCCASRWEGDSDRCVDTALNPEHCGACGETCESGACRASACIASPTCSGTEPCTDDLVCSDGAGQPGRCCPVGTAFTANISSFFGCCPTGDECGCQEGACPISSPERKFDIRLLDDAELAVLGQALLDTRLSTWRYEHDPMALRLGFLIDADAPPYSVAPGGETVDLYGYISLAVAALKSQRLQLTRLKGEVDDLRLRLEKLENRDTRPSK